MSVPELPKSCWRRVTAGSSSCFISTAGALLPGPVGPLVVVSSDYSDGLLIQSETALGSQIDGEQITAGTYGQDAAGLIDVLIQWRVIKTAAETSRTGSDGHNARWSRICRRS